MSYCNNCGSSLLVLRTKQNALPQQNYVVKLPLSGPHNKFSSYCKCAAGIFKFVTDSFSYSKNLSLGLLMGILG